MSGGVLGKIVNGASDAISDAGKAVGNVVNQVTQSPILRDAALVTAAIYAPELIASVGTDAESADLALAAQSSTPVIASTPSVLTAEGAGDLTAGTGMAGGTTALAPVANASAGLNPSFDTLGNVLQTGDMNSQLAPSITDLSGNTASGVSTLGGASTPVASSMSDIMTPTGYTYAGDTAKQLASAASALSTANNLLNPSQTGGSSGFAQPSGLSGSNVGSSTTGGGQGSTGPYNENLKMMGNYLSPIQAVNTSGIVPSYRSLQSPVYAKRGGEIHDEMGHPEYPKSPLETVFSTRGGTHYVQGKGTGQSDDIDAKLADGEYVFDADTVAALGDGSNKAGAQALDKMREAIRAHKRSAPDNKIPPKAKSPLAYFEEGNRK